MRVAVFDAQNYDRTSLDEVNKRFGHELVYFEPRLTPKTASLAKGFPVVCSFVNDNLARETLVSLQTYGCRLVTLRSAGFNHVDLSAARELGITICRVPEYSPHAVAEHAVALILTLNRKIHRANNRVHELNFSLDGLVGFDLFKKTVGIIGTGKIGTAFARIMNGFGCECLAFDINKSDTLIKEIGIKYVSLDELYVRSDIISLHVPLTPDTKHCIDSKSIALMKPGLMFINTSRGALVDSKALIAGLKSGKIGYAGLDVYEEEAGVFFQNLSEKILQDDILARLLTFPNVLITSHQAFLTREALQNIAFTTLESIRQFEAGEILSYQIK